MPSDDRRQSRPQQASELEEAVWQWWRQELGAIRLRQGQPADQRDSISDTGAAEDPDAL